MLRLVSLSDSGEPFRTPLPASVVAALDPVRRRLLDLLVRGRLVTSADGGYDLAHEALVRAWPRLRVWLEEDRVGQQIRRHLAMAAAGWQALDRPESELYRGARLGAALEWLERGHEPLDDTQRDFIEASRAVADEDVRRLADEARRQRRQNRRLRARRRSAAVLLMVAAAAGVVARRDQGLAAKRGEGSAARPLSLPRPGTSRWWHARSACGRAMRPLPFSPSRRGASNRTYWRGRPLLARSRPAGVPRLPRHQPRASTGSLSPPLTVPDRRRPARRRRQQRAPWLDPTLRRGARPPSLQRGARRTAVSPLRARRQRGRQPRAVAAADRVDRSAVRAGRLAPRDQGLHGAGRLRPRRASPGDGTAADAASAVRTSPSAATARSSPWRAAGAGTWPPGTCRSRLACWRTSRVLDTVPAPRRCRRPPCHRGRGLRAPATGSTSAPRSRRSSARCRRGRSACAAPGRRLHAHDQPSGRRRQRPATGSSPAGEHGTARRRPARRPACSAVAGGHTTGPASPAATTLAVSAKAGCRPTARPATGGRSWSATSHTGERCGPPPRAPAPGRSARWSSRVAAASSWRSEAKRSATSPGGGSTGPGVGGTLLAARSGRHRSGPADPTGRLLLVGRQSRRARAETSSTPPPAPD